MIGLKINKTYRFNNPERDIFRFNKKMNLN